MKARPWRHIYHDIEIPRPKSHGIEKRRQLTHDIVIPRHFFKGQKATTSRFWGWKTTTLRFQDQKATTWSSCRILTLMPPDTHTWWLFSLPADLLDRKIKVIGSWKVEKISSRFLRNLLTRYLRRPNYPWFEVISKLAIQRAKKWEVVRRMSEESDKVIHVYPTNPAL